MDLKTTTRPQRHAALFTELRELLTPAAGGRPLELLEVGAGLAVKYLGRLSAQSVPGWDIFRRIETGVRRVPMPDAFFENYETHELLAALAGIPLRLTLLDINPKVVRVIGKSLPDRQIETVIADLGVERPPALLSLFGKFDVVVALTVLARVSARAGANASANLCDLLKPGGLLLGSGALESAECKRIAGHEVFYRKRER